MTDSAAEHTLLLLGAPRLEDHGQPVPITRRKLMALLAYLAVTQQPHRREALATLLWPDAPRQHAFAYLRRTLSLAKKAAGEDVLAVSRELVGWQATASLGIDVVEFRRCLADVQAHNHATNELCPGCLAQLTRAAGFYHGDFLAGFTLPDAPAFEEWQFWQVEALQQDFVSTLKQLADHYAAQAQLETAIIYARRLVEMDPLHEPAQQQLIRLYAAAGQQTAAQRQHEVFAVRMAEEIGTLPTSATLVLARQLQAPAPPFMERTGHGRCYLRFLQQRAADLHGGRQEEALADIRAELDNVRAAWYGALATADALAMERALEPLFSFYFMKGFFWYGVDDFAQALSVWPPQRDGRLAARLLIRQGHLYLCLAQPETAEARLHTGIQLLTDCDEEAAFDLALAQTGLGSLALYTGQLREAQSLYQECLVIFRALGDKLMEARTLSNLGSVACGLGEVVTAQRLDEESLALYHHLDNPLGVATALNNLSHYAELRGNYTRAKDLLQESLRITFALRCHWLSAVALSNLGHLASLQNQYREAARHYQDSLALRLRHRLPGVSATRRALAGTRS